jgi:hypothetical protein
MMSVETVRIEAESYTAAAPGVQIFGLIVGNFNSGRWIRFDNVDCKFGVQTIRANGDAGSTGNLSFRIGSESATPFGVINWQTTGAFATGAAAASSVVTGVQTLFVSNDTINFINLDWIELDRQTQPLGGGGGAGPTDIVSALRQTIETCSPALRNAAADAIIRIGGLPAVAAGIALLNNPNPAIQELGMYILGSTGALAIGAIPALQLFLTNPSEFLQQRAIETIYLINPAAGASLALLVQSPNDWVRLAAANILGTQGAGGTSLLSILLNDPNCDVRARAAELLAFQQP